MDSYRRRSPDTTVGNSSPSADGAALEDAGRLLRRLIPFPGGADALPALGIPLLSLRGGHPKGSPLADLVPDAVRQPADAIVSAAAAILDEEMARGVLAARNVTPSPRPGVPPPDQGNALLRQVHDLIDNAARIWPSVQSASVSQFGAPQPVATDADPLAEVRPRETVKPGQRATISMALRNSESRPVRLVPSATDLLGSRGGRIACSLLEFTPSEFSLEPQEQKDLAIATTVPVDAAPGCYSGLLVVRGLDYLRALITIEVV